MKKVLLGLSALALVAALAAPAAQAKTNIDVDVWLNPYNSPGYPGYGYDDGYDDDGYDQDEYDRDYGHGRRHRDRYDHEREGRYIGRQVLGVTRLSYGNDVDRVMVNTCANGMKVDAVKLRVTRNFANIDFIALTFKNGESMRLRVRHNFAPDSESRWIRLGGLRCIRSFVVYGDTNGLPITRAKVKLIGNAYERR